MRFKQRVLNEFLSHSAEETKTLGKLFAQVLKENDVVGFFSDLGGGKTTFIKGIMQTLSPSLEEEAVTSPTFIYVNTYENRALLHHFDLYRLKDSQQFIDMGFLDYVSNQSICLIEWAEKIENLLPSNCYVVSLQVLSPHQRKIEIARCYEDEP